MPPSGGFFVYGAHMDFLSGVVGSAVATGVFTIVGWLLKRSIAQLDEKIKGQDKRMEAQDDALQKRADELSSFKLHCAETYVTQSELTKAVSSLERSIERLIEAVNLNSKETREGFSQLHLRIDGKADK